jgi:hypothetical protein
MKSDTIRGLPLTVKAWRRSSPCKRCSGGADLWWVPHTHNAAGGVVTRVVPMRERATLSQNVLLYGYDNIWVKWAREYMGTF